MLNGTRRLELKISKETDALIDDIAKDAGCSRAEVLRRGLSVMKAFQMQRKVGQVHIGFTKDPSNLDSEVVGLL